MPRPRPSRSRARRPRAIARCRTLWGTLLVAVALSGCATAGPARQPLSDEARTALTLLERRWETFSDLRTRAEISIRRGNRVERLAGVLLLLRAPASMRFEALSPFGVPVLLVASDPKSVTYWEVLNERAVIAPASPEATRRWLGVALGEEELVALLAGRVLPPANPGTAEVLPADGMGPSLVLAGPDGRQRIWFEPDTGQIRQVEWTGGRNPARVAFDGGPTDGPPAGLKLETLDGSLSIGIAYRSPRMNTGLDPDLLRVTVPEHVKIQDFR